MLQQLLLGLARQAERAVVRVGNTRVAERSTQLLEVGFLDGVPAGVHGRGGVPSRAGEKAVVRIYSFGQDPLQLTELGIRTPAAVDSQLLRGTFRSLSAEQRNTELKLSPKPCNALPEGHRKPDPPSQGSQHPKSKSIIRLVPRDLPSSTETHACSRPLSTALLADQPSVSRAGSQTLLCPTALPSWRNPSHCCCPAARPSTAGTTPVQPHAC